MARREARTLREFLDSGLPAQPAWRDYASLDEMRRDLEETPASGSVAPASTDEGETIGAGGRERLGRGRDFGDARLERKTLNFSAVIKDVSIHRKYGISARQCFSWRTSARQNVDEVLAEMNRHMVENGFVNVSVRMDSMRGFSAEAREHIESLAEGIAWPVQPIKMCAIPPYTHAYIIDPPYEDDEWEISCRGSSLSTALYVWRLCKAWGPRRVVDELTDDLAILHVSITDRGGAAYMSSYEYHMGSAVESRLSHDFEDHGYARVEAVEMASYVDAVQPVLKNGVPQASVVAVGPGMWLMSGHVRENGVEGCTFLGKPLTKYSYVRAYGVQWVLIASNLTVTSQVLYRSPEEDEKVRLVYYDGTSWYRSPVYKCTRRNLHHVVVPVDNSYDVWAVAGMSGSMYVAEADGAVVAVHEGYSATVGTIVIPIDARALSSRIGGLTASGGMTLYYSADATSSKVLNSTVSLMKRDRARYARVENIVQNLVNVSGCTGLKTAYGVVAVVSGHDGILTESDVSVQVVSPYGLRVVGREPTVVDFAMRPAERDEAVIAVGRNETGAYVTDSVNMHVSERLGPPTLRFESPELLGLHGSVLVAVSDAAIVGWLADTDVSMSDGTYRRACIAVRKATAVARAVEEISTSSSSAVVTADTTFNTLLRVTVMEPSLDGIIARLSDLFPYLRVSLYDPVLLEEAFTHSSRRYYDLGPQREFNANRYLARVGDAVMLARLQLYMRQNGTPGSIATTLKNVVQTNVRQAAIVRDLHLNELYRGGSVPPVLSEHAMADLLEAVVALVYIAEDASTLDRFLTDVNMIVDSVD